MKVREIEGPEKAGGSVAVVARLSSVYLCGEFVDSSGYVGRAMPIVNKRECVNTQDFAHGSNKVVRPQTSVDPYAAARRAVSSG